MANSFIAYIDEAGDQGFKFYDNPKKPGSKRWFILSAAVVRLENDKTLHESVGRLRQDLWLQEKQPIHFTDLNHAQRVKAVQGIAKMPIQIINVLVEKRRLSNPEAFADAGFRLYFYSMRLILERLSWLCGETKDPGPCKPVFERCKGLNYGALHEYFDLLKTKGRDPVLGDKVNIKWEFLNTDKAKIEDKSTLGALQVADCCASSAQWATEKRHGDVTEHRYIKALKPRVYARERNYRSYGMKFLVPNPSLHWADKYYP